MTAKLIVLASLLLVGCSSWQPPRELLGPYRLESGTVVSIGRSTEGTLRYRVFATGQSGRLYRQSDGSYVSGAGFAVERPATLSVRFEDAEPGPAPELRWQASDRPEVEGIRIGREREVRFSSDGVSMAARLQLPEGPPPYPAVVLVHGSGTSPGTEWLYNADFFVAAGIAALTYDKRGTGRSGGDFTFDFDQLARDAVAAVDAVARDSDIDADRIVLAGYSQGGWVAPLASTRSSLVRGVLVSFGMIESPAEEARLEMRQLLIDAGVSGADLEDADELIRAAVELVASEFEQGWPVFEAARRRHGGAPWLRHLDGTPVDQLMSYPRFLVEFLAPRRLPPGLPWHYDSTGLLEATEIPMVWLLGGEDRSAPNAQTISKLRRWEQAGRPVELLLFPSAGHGMVIFDDGAAGREVTGYAPGYFRAETQAARRLIGLEELVGGAD